MILNLPELIKNQPKRKIGLKFKPSKMSLRTELWYRNELLALVHKFRQAVEGGNFYQNEITLIDKSPDDELETKRVLGAVEID